MSEADLAGVTSKMGNVQVSADRIRAFSVLRTAFLEYLALLPLEVFVRCRKWDIQCLVSGASTNCCQEHVIADCASPNGLSGPQIPTDDPDDADTPLLQRTCNDCCKRTGITPASPAHM